jgi:hypothetical protein
MDHAIVSADIAEVRCLMILVGSLALTSSGILQGRLRHTVKTGGNYNLYERDIEAKQRSGQNLPANSQYTLVLPQRNEHLYAVRIMQTAPLNDWSKGLPRTDEIWSRSSASATSITTTSRKTSAMSSTATPMLLQQLHLLPRLYFSRDYNVQQIPVSFAFLIFRPKFTMSIFTIYAPFLLILFIISVININYYTFWQFIPVKLVLKWSRLGFCMSRVATAHVPVGNSLPRQNVFSWNIFHYHCDWTTIYVSSILLKMPSVCN